MKNSLAKLGWAVALSSALAVSPAIAQTKTYTQEQIQALIAHYKPEIVQCENGQPGVLSASWDEEKDDMVDICMSVKDWVIENAEMNEDAENIAINNVWWKSQETPVGRAITAMQIQLDM